MKKNCFPSRSLFLFAPCNKRILAIKASGINFTPSPFPLFLCFLARETRGVESGSNMRWSSICRINIATIALTRFMSPVAGLAALSLLPMHYGRKQPRIQTVVLGHSLVRSLVRSYRSLVRLLRTARFARALRCAHSFARSLTSLTPSLVGK